jgi:hypothetical protein
VDLSPSEVIAFISDYLILPAALGPGVYSASGRQAEHGRCVKLTTLPPSVMLNISQPVMGIALCYFTLMLRFIELHNTISSSSYVVSNGGTVNWKGCGRKQSWRG